MMRVLDTLPDNLPVPTDDGAGAHLTGAFFPPLCLPSTNDEDICLTEVSQRQRVVVYCYPLTGRPDRDLPEGWLGIPGAAGCTPQSCGFRDRHQELHSLQVQVFGLSTQTTAYQQEVVERLHLPFALLSDADLQLAHALSLPTFEVDGMVLLQRLTMIIANGQIEKVFYPVFPPDRNAGDVEMWLRAHPQANCEL